MSPKKFNLVPNFLAPTLSTMKIPSLPSLSPKSLAGPGYIILNTLRVMNIIGLLAVICASMVMLVKTVITSELFFFDAVSHCITGSISTFLIVSELCLFRSYFDRCWPLLSPAHGFVTLGVAMLILGVSTLGNLNKDATSQKSLGLAFWRIVIGAGILILILGVFNIIASFLFRDHRTGVTARQVRASGAVAITRAQQNSIRKSHSFASSHASSSKTSYTTPKSNTQAIDFANSTPKTPPNKYSPRRIASFFGGTPATHVNANTTGTTNTTTTTPPRRNNSTARPPLPSYHTSPAASSKYSYRPGHNDVPDLPHPPYPTTWSPPPRNGAQSQRPMEISGPIGINPQFAHLVRPDSAYHPSRQGGLRMPGGMV